jgi:two-component system OmpR family response regulator
MAEVDDRIKGLQSGGDDYLIKPFSFGELLARVEAIIRRSRELTERTYLVVGNLHMDIMKHKVYRTERQYCFNRGNFTFSSI